MSFETRAIRTERKPVLRIPRFLILLLKPFVALKRIAHEKKIPEEQTQRRGSLLKRTAIVLLSVFLVLLLVAGVLRVLITLRLISLSSFLNIAGTELPYDEDGFTNILLLGVGDANHEGIDLTDTVMVASLDPAHSQSVVLLSIPRDLYLLSTEKMGKGRINSLYRNHKGYLMSQGKKEGEASLESMKELASEVGSWMGLPIHAAVKVNFSGFEQAIDAIGGIDVDLPEDLVDSEYPLTETTVGTFELKAGHQHLDGATALKYARSRHSTSDFSRSARQQQILAAAVQRAKETGLIRNIGRINDILGIVSRNIESTMSVREMIGLAALGRKIDHNRTISTQLSDLSGYDGIAAGGGLLYAPPRDPFEGASVLLPISTPEFPITWKQIRIFVSLLVHRREWFLHPPSIAILNAGSPEGTASRLGMELMRFGFNVVSTMNYPRTLPLPDHSLSAVRKKPRSTDATYERSQSSVSMAKYLSTVLGLPSGTLDPQVELKNDPDVVLVLGREFRFKLLQTFLEQQ